MTLREGRAELHDRLNAAADEGLGEEPDDADPHGLAHWTRQQLCDLLIRARDAVLRCPHVERCTICFTLEKDQEGSL